MSELLEFFKALAEPNRLKIIGLLAQQPRNVEDLASLLNLRASTVSHHLMYLRHVGLVSAQADGWYSRYQLEFSALQELSKQLLNPQDLVSENLPAGLPAYDRRVLENYTRPDGSLRQIPAQRKKLEVLLRQIVQVFEPERKYSGREVNEMLSRYHADTATLRRELVGYGLLARQADGEVWWRVNQKLDT